MVTIAGFGFLFTLLSILLDIISINIAFALSILARTKIYGPIDASLFFEICILSTIILIILLFSFNQYRQKRNLFDVDELIAIAKSIALTAFIIISFTYLSKSSIIYSRFVVVLSFVIAFFLIVFLRYILRNMLGILRSKGYNTKKAFILGNSDISKLLRNKLKENPQLGYKLTSSIKSCDTAFICSKDEKDILNVIFSHPNIEFKIIPDVIQTITEPAKFDEFIDIPLITVKKSSSKKGYLVIKRIFDIIFSLLLIILTSPLFVLISTINIILYKKIFFIQKRFGKGLKEFRLYKFQTMKQGKKPRNEAAYLFKVRKDPRANLFGKLLRRTVLDELPQLFNILSGNMSLVGPRPHIEEELHLFKGWKLKRFSVKPGLTGLWQVSGRHELNSEKAAAIDLYYVNQMSLALDLKIILKTIPSIIFSRGKW